MLAWNTFLMKKTDFLYPDWMTTSTIPCQATEQMAFCSASFRPGRKMTRPRNFYFTSSSLASTASSGSDLLTETQCRMNNVQFMSGPDISGFDRNKPLSKIKDKRGSFPFIEKAFFEQDREDKGLNSLSVCKSVSFKNINLKNSLIKGEQLLSFKGSNSATAPDTDEVLSVETFLSSSNTSGANYASTVSSSTKPVLANGQPTLTMTTNSVLQRKPVAMITTNSKSNPSYAYNGINNGITIRSMGGNFNSKEEPKYADPLSGATASFQQRIMELASLEAETIRWERLKKVKKKTKDRDS
ncbi:AAC-rich mRNA AAC11 protein [Biomphalaria glabrata]|uniref:Uncharacterized protein n=1 Tax=Biomphalaria glabrata TaxID=6526 RepID=A0A2C9LF55_BIOGL|nr:AAC-rich mRNA AAC11 protein [Biomphalaria glabrata]